MFYSSHFSFINGSAIFIFLWFLLQISVILNFCIRSVFQHYNPLTYIHILRHFSQILSNCFSSLHARCPTYVIIVEDLACPNYLHYHIWFFLSPTLPIIPSVTHGALGQTATFYNFIFFFLYFFSLILFIIYINTLHNL